MVEKNYLAYCTTCRTVRAHMLYKYAIIHGISSSNYQQRADCWWKGPIANSDIARSVRGQMLHSVPLPMVLVLPTANRVQVGGGSGILLTATYLGQCEARCDAVPPYSYSHAEKSGVAPRVQSTPQMLDARGKLDTIIGPLIVGLGARPRSTFRKGLRGIRRRHQKVT